MYCYLQTSELLSGKAFNIMFDTLHVDVRNVSIITLDGKDIVISNYIGKLYYAETRVIARNTCLNLNQNDYTCGGSINIDFIIGTFYKKSLVSSTEIKTAVNYFFFLAFGQH